MQSIQAFLYLALLDSFSRCQSVTPPPPPREAYVSPFYIYAPYPVC